MNINELASFKYTNNKITALTCYDASFATILTKQGIDIILVGDTLGQAIQGHRDTIPVTIQDVIYHTKSVVNGVNNAINCLSKNINSNSKGYLDQNKPLIISDMPFMSYYNTDTAFANSAKLMQSGCEMVKLEGGVEITDIVEQLSIRGIPVCAHIGLMPQHYHQLGGFRVQGKSEESATKLINDAKVLEQSGAKLIVLECIPHTLAAKISTLLTIPTIGIGSGLDVNGQILVLYDILGISNGKKLKFTHNFISDGNGNNNDIPSAIKNYILAVKSGLFPKQEHCYNYNYASN